MSKLIAIDGPAGVGKSSVGKALAKKFEINFFSTGEMYRCLAWKVLEQGIDPQDEKAVLEIAQKVKWTYQAQDNVLKVYIDGICPLDKIHNEEVGRAASKVSAIPAARILIMDEQKKLAHLGNIVLEGRDIGTQIAPFSKVKIYLTASAKARADRRVKQLKEAGQNPVYEEILASIISRDERDSNRKIAPLKPAEDALIIDTSDLTLEEVINKVLEVATKNVW
jgi:cytidylate kinase